MDQPLLRLRVDRKLADGHLPLTTIIRTWGGPGDGRVCDACDEIITSVQFVLDDAPSRARALQFHVDCFRVWDAARLARVASLRPAPAPGTSGA